MKRLTALMLLAAMTSCAHPAPVLWKKEGATPASFYTDKMSCKKDAAGGTHTSYGLYHYSSRTEIVYDMAVYRECMAAHGYQLMS